MGGCRSERYHETLKKHYAIKMIKSGDNIDDKPLIILVALVGAADS